MQNKFHQKDVIATCHPRWVVFPFLASLRHLVIDLYECLMSFGIESHAAINSRSIKQGNDRNTDPHKRLFFFLARPDR